MDFVQYLLGHGIPDTCICAGLIALLQDDREVPDTWSPPTSSRSSAARSPSPGA